MPRARSAKKVEDKVRYRQVLTESIREFVQAHGIDKQRFTEVMREVFMEVLGGPAAKSESATNPYRIILDPEKGDLEIYRLRKIVPDHEVEDEAYEVPISEALEKEPDCKVGETLYEEISLESLTRAQIERLKERLRTQLRDLDRAALYERYKQMVGEIITGDVLKITRDELIVLHEGNELSLPRSELIPEKDNYVSKDRMGSRFQGGTYRRGEAPTSIVKAVVERVLNPREVSPYRPIVILSRTSPSFLKALLKLEIPEIYDGIISIKKVVRYPGKRAKVLVESYDERIDPVGACVGVRGSRIQPIVRELRGEYIDIIPYNPDVKLMISRALAPATVMYVDLYPSRRYAKVFVAPEEYAKAVGQEGINVRLAEELLGYQLDIREGDEYGEEEDIELMEFSDEIPESILRTLQREGFQTARAVLQFPIDELQKRTQIDLPTLQKVYEILQSEFEE